MIASRRSFLKTLGIGAAAAGLPMVGRRASAGPSPIPKRIVFFYGSGMLYDVWRPTGTETSFELGKVHAPLAPHKSDLIVLDGLGMVSEEIDTGPSGNAHNQGAKHSLAATNTTVKDRPGGPSIDQLIATKLKEAGVVTQFPSLEFQVASWTNELEAFSGAVASAANTVLPGMWDPRKAFDRIFGSFTDTGAAADALRKRQLAVMGLAKEEFSRLKVKLSSDEQKKLDTHVSLVSDLEARLGAVARTCIKPDRKTLEAQITQKCDFACYSPDSPEVFARNWDLSSKLNADLMVAALACDLTRVSFMEVHTAANSLVGYKEGDFGTTDLHDLVHKVNDRVSTQSKDPAARAVIEKVCTLEAQRLADLITKMKAVPESDGQTLFDHSVILWCSQIGYGSHDLADLPWVIAGDANGYFKTGRYLRLPDNPKSKRGQPHNELFVSLANAMDVPLTTFGNPACCGGPLAGLR
jgi:hypothetical protein